MSTQETTTSLSKWQIALLVGAPVAAVCVFGAVWYFRRSSNTDSDPEENADEDKNKTSASEEKSNIGEELVS